jgi:release factor glutamine methyltransferase
VTTVGEILPRLREMLTDLDPGGREAELLLAAALQLDRGRLVAFPETVVSPSAEAHARALVAGRAAGQPVAYLLGSREFWSLSFEVTPDVLVPRPDSELLVERGLAALACIANPAIVDLGTGSGAIGLALGFSRPDARVDLVDVSAAALAVARRNARRLALHNVACHEGEWFAPLAGRRYDLIVSNPPYLAADDPQLRTDGLCHEPPSALVAGPTGLEALAAIAAEATAHLAADAVLLLEHGATQGAAVRKLLRAGGLVAVTTLRDLGGHERVTEGRKSR